MQIDPDGLGAGRSERDAGLGPGMQIDTAGNFSCDLDQGRRLTQRETSAVSTGKRKEKKGGTKL